VDSTLDADQGLVIYESIWRFQQLCSRQAHMRAGLPRMKYSACIDSEAGSVGKAELKVQ